MIMQAIQLFQLFKGIKEMVDSDDNSLTADHVNKMVQGLGSEMHEGMNKMIDDDGSQPHKNVLDFLKG